MDWRQVDLTLEGHIGGNAHPDMPWELRRQQSEGDLYTHIFRDYRIDGARVLQADREAQWGGNAANGFMEFFGRFPAWAKEKYGWLNGAMAGGDCCDRCMIEMNLLNTSQPGCCDQCEKEMMEQMAANPEVVFAFERGGLVAVA